MLLNEKKQIEALLDELPPAKARSLLDFALYLKQQSLVTGALPVADSEPDELTDWERELLTAESYWFSLPEETRRSYEPRMVAVLGEHIIDSHENLSVLRRRVHIQYPNRPVLLIEANAEHLEILAVRTPHLR